LNGVVVVVVVDLRWLSQRLNPTEIHSLLFSSHWLSISTTTATTTTKTKLIDDYRAHTSCITEAERYEKKTPADNDTSRNKPKKRNPQQEWMDVVMTCSENMTTNTSINHSAANAVPSHVHSYLQAMAKLDNIPRKEKQFINFMVNSFGGCNGSRRKGQEDNLLDICHQLWNILQQEKDRRRNNKLVMESDKKEQSTTTGTNNENKVTHFEGTNVNNAPERITTTTNNKPSSTKCSQHPSTTATTTIKDVEENGPTATTATSSATPTTIITSTMDTKKVQRAVKKALKRAPDHSMTIKALRKVLIRDYGIFIPCKSSEKVQLNQIIQSYQKVKIDGKIVTLRLNHHK
jgi:hypothetical protein